MYFVLMFLPVLNDVFETGCQLQFVGMRSLTSGFYTLYMIAFCYFLIFISTFLKSKMLYGILKVTFVVFSVLSIFSQQVASGINIRMIQTVLDNPKLVPNSTLELGKKLENLASEDEFNVLMPEFLSVDGMNHSLATIIRSITTNINSISAIPRYPVKNEKYGSFYQEDQEKFESFNNEKTYESYLKCLETVEKFDIDCMVLSGDSSQIVSYLDEFNIVDKVVDEKAGVEYTILLKQ